MAVTISELSFTASEIGTYEGCAARFYHGTQRYTSGLLPTNQTAADVGSTVHDALMELHRQIEQQYRRGKQPETGAEWEHLRNLLSTSLRKRRLDHRNAGVQARLESAKAGLRRAVGLIIDDMPRWLLDPERRQLLVWVESPLNHGLDVKAVELEPGYLVRTRPDLIGLRLNQTGSCRPLVRDYKTRVQAVHPAFDTGILIRAIWVLAELRHPRCVWFMKGRALEVDAASIDLETVNLLHGDGEEFILRATLSEHDLLEQRDRLVETMRGMASVLQAETAGEVLASPGDLCLDWCQYLAYCPAGMDHVSKYAGEEALAQRLAAC